MGGGRIGPGYEMSDGETFLQCFKDFCCPLWGAVETRRRLHRSKQYLQTHKMDPRTHVQLSPIQPFINEVEKGGVGCSGVLQRLDAHSLALKFMNFNSENETLPLKAYNPPDLSGVDRLLTDVSISEEFHVTSQDILDNTEQPTKKQYNTCLAIVAGRVLYSNAQRPGAVAGALMSEFEEGFRARREGQSVAREAQSLTRQGPVYKGTFVFPWNLNKIILAFNLQIIFTTYIIVMMQLIQSKVTHLNARHIFWGVRTVFQFCVYNTCFSYVYVIAHLGGLINRNITTKGAMSLFNFAPPLSTMTSKKLLRACRQEYLRVLTVQ